MSFRSWSTIRVAVLVMLRDADNEVYPFQMIKKLDLKSGSLYPILRGLEEEGLVMSWHEDQDPVVIQRKARHYYAITELGRNELARIIDWMGLS